MKLVGVEYVVEVKKCPTCGGAGKVRSGNHYSRTQTDRNGLPCRTPCSGALIPCPQCRGRKTIEVATKKDKE